MRAHLRLPCVPPWLLSAAALVLAACNGTDPATRPTAMPQQAGAPTTAALPTPVATAAPMVAPVSTPAATDVPLPATTSPQHEVTMEAFPVPGGTHPHDVAPAPDGTVWFTGQTAGYLGRLDPQTGDVRQVALGNNSAPHGVIVGPDGAAWVTDGGQNAIVRVDGQSEEVRVFPLPRDRPAANLNTATFDNQGMLWFTGQAGVYGQLDPQTGAMRVYDAPRGRGPYGIATAPNGDVYFASLAGSYVGRIDTETGEATVLEPPTEGQGARRVWPDSQGRVWVSEWNAGNVAMYDPAADAWREWKLPGDAPRPYAIYVDERDKVWLSDFASNALVRFDPATEQFASFPLPDRNGSVRQLLGRPGAVWGAESSSDRLVVVRMPEQ